MAMIGQNLATLSTTGQHDNEQMSALLREGRWEGVVRRRGLTGSEATVAVRQIVVRNADGTLLWTSLNSGEPRRGLSEAATGRMDAELQAYLAACWELDISPAQSVLRTIGELRSRGIIDNLDEHPEWVDKLLTATRISAVNNRAVRMFGAHAGLEQMIGQPAGAFLAGRMPFRARCSARVRGK